MNHKTPDASGVRKPRGNYFDDVNVECVSEDYDDHGGGAFCIVINGQPIYTAKQIRRLIKWLEKAERWIANKELYK